MCYHKDLDVKSLFVFFPLPLVSHTGLMILVLQLCAAAVFSPIPPLRLVVQPASAQDPQQLLGNSQQLDNSCPANVEGSKGSHPIHPPQFNFFHPPASAPSSHYHHLFNFIKSTPSGAGVVRGRSGMGLVAVESPAPPHRLSTAPEPPSFRPGEKTSPSKRPDLGEKSSLGNTRHYMWETNGAVVDAALSPNANSFANTTAGYFPSATQLTTARFRHGPDTIGSTSDMPALLWQKGKKLGEGSFGSVFSALDLLTGQRVAYLITKPTPDADVQMQQECSMGTDGTMMSCLCQAYDSQLSKSLSMMRTAVIRLGSRYVRFLVPDD